MNKLIRYFPILLVFVTAIGWAPSVHAAERVQVILVQADNSGQGVEGSLKPYAGNLQQLLNFNTYRQVARKGIQLDVPGEGSASLPGGQTLLVKAGSQDGPAIIAEVTWMRGNKRLVHTRIQLRKGTPAVIGGPRGGDGPLLVILELE